MTQLDTVAVRDAFPIFRERVHGQPLTYLDSAATTHKPQQVIDAVSEFYAHANGTVHRAVYQHAVAATERFQAVRQQVADLLNASSASEIVFTKGATDSINLVAYSFGKRFIEPGDEVIISQMEHHANIVPWQIMCEERGAVLKFIPVTDKGELDLEGYRSLLNKRTKMVAVVHTSNTLGTVNPVKEIVAQAKSFGAYTLVDGAQSIPDMPVDVQDIDCDFCVFSGHKLYAPTGVGVLYGRYELLEQLPPYQTGGSMIDRVRLDQTTFDIPPQRFEAGTPMIAQVIGLGMAIDFVRDIGLDVIHKHKLSLLSLLEAQLRDIEQLKILGNAPVRSGTCSFVVEGVHPLDIGTLLDLKGIAVRTGHHCTMPLMDFFGIEACTRVSFGAYNNTEDVERFVAGLKSVLGQLIP